MDFSKIEEQIANLTPYQAIQEMPASVLNEAIRSMQALLDVARAAAPIANNLGASYARKKELREALARLEDL